MVKKEIGIDAAAAAAAASASAAVSRETTVKTVVNPGAAAAADLDFLILSVDFCTWEWSYNPRFLILLSRGAPRPRGREIMLIG